MDPGLSSNSIPPPPHPPGSIDKSKVLDIKPLRFLVPIFPHSSGNSSISASQPSPFACIPPAGPFPSGVQPFYPFLGTENIRRPQSRAANLGDGSNTPDRVQLNSLGTPSSQVNGGTGKFKRPRGRPRSVNKAVDV